MFIVVCCVSACDGYGDVVTCIFGVLTYIPMDLDVNSDVQSCPGFDMFPKLQHKSARSNLWLEIYFEGDGGLAGWIFATGQLAAINAEANETGRLEMPNGRFNRVREPSSAMGSFKETTGDRTEGRKGFSKERIN